MVLLAVHYRPLTNHAYSRLIMKEPLIKRNAALEPGLLHSERGTIMDQNRRIFTMKVIGLAAAAATGMGIAEAAEHHQTRMSTDGWSLDADTKFRCGTCRYWGGMRKISDDRKQVVAVSLGWCNNQASPMYRMLTPADHEMTKAGVWTKWEALA